MSSTKILVVDDEPNIRKLIKNILEDEGYEVVEVESGNQAFRLVQEQDFDCVLLDVWMPGMNGLEVLELIKAGRESLPVIMISGHANVDLAVQALKKGAFDFIEKPLGTERILAVVHNSLEFNRLKKENRFLRSRLSGHSEMIGTSKAMQDLRKLVEQAAKSEVPVFITGENGTGKELVAREIHRRSHRQGKPFVAVNCAAIPDALIESELFGHEKGAFTGAAAQKKGRFEMANEGTLFLDEIIDLSLSAQAKVLRALQEQLFERVGGTGSVKVDVRVLAASNKDPHLAMRDKRFRDDLFFRLHVLPVFVPALRDRTEDIPLLVTHFLSELAVENLSAEPLEYSMSATALKLLCDYSWPGNIRQLRNIIRRILVISSANEIDHEIVELALAADRPLEQALAIDNDQSTGDLGIDFSGLGLSEAKEVFEKNFLIQKLKEYDYNVSQTAESLGMYPSHLHAKIKKLQINVEK